MEVVESFNGLVRQYHERPRPQLSEPVGLKFEAETNDRPRRIHGYVARLSTQHQPAFASLAKPSCGTVVKRFHRLNAS